MKSSIFRSVAKDVDRYSPHRTSAGVHLNEPESVAFASSKKFMQGSFLHVHLGL